MADGSNRDLVELLLERDLPFNDEEYSIHRRQLDERLRKASRDERVVRIATISAWIGAASFFVLALAMQRLAPRGGLPAGLLGDVILPGITLLCVACGAVAAPMLILYLVRYRRAIDQARDSARDAVLFDLQQLLAQCKARLEGRNEPS